jgi:hypothetical protein
MNLNLISIFATSEKFLENNEHPSSEEGLWMARPLATLGAAYLGVFEIVFESQSVIRDKLAINIINDIGFMGENIEYIFTGLNVGPQYNITGMGIEGLYIGLYPGIFLMLENYSNDLTLLFTTLAECGYQRIDGLVAWGGYIGCFYNTGSNALQFKWGLKIGIPYRSETDYSN